ncbi:MAG: acyl-ACP--UDP-N-acetylglucosamine O-acyltransferase [Chthoniobacterales bacterium]
MPAAVTIHPTAIVDPRAELGAGCVVGPYCIVEAGVVLGPECWLQHHVTLCGPTTTGARNKFYAYCSIGQQTQDLKYAGEPTYLEIGDGNTFREFCTVNRSTTAEGKTRIGRGGNFLAYSHIGHDCTVGDKVIFSNNGTLAGHVEVGDHAIMGGLTAVHQFCRLGRYAITGGCSKIVQDVPPFMIADGNPAEIRGVNLVGLERNGFAPESVKRIKEAFRIIYRSKLNTRQAVEAVQKDLPPSEEITQILEFITRSERGITR